MRDHDDDAKETVEVILENLQRLDVEIVRRLIEQQHIGLAHQNQKQLEPPPFPAGEISDLRPLHLLVKQELLTHLGGCDQPVRRPDVFSDRLHTAQNRLLRIHFHGLLTEIADLHRLPDRHRTGIRLNEPRNHIHDGRLSASISPDEADPVIPQKPVGEMGKQYPVPVGFRDILQLDRLLPKACGYGADRQRTLLHPCPRFPGCLAKILKTINPRLLLGGACLCPPPDPGQLRPQQVLPFILRPDFCLIPLLLALKPDFVAAVHDIQPAPVQLRNPVCHTVQKVPVVCNQQQLALEAPDGILQEEDHLLVEVVGRLVQNQHLSGRQKRLRQCDPLPLPA